MINIENGEYYGNFDTYFKFEENKLIVTMHLDYDKDIISEYIREEEDKYVQIDNNSIYFNIFSNINNKIVLIDNTETIFELKKYTFIHKLLIFLGYDI
jgi:hypothetical protein